MRGRTGMFVGVLIVCLLAAVGAILVWPAKAQTVTISVSATPGTKVTGNYEVDGIKSEIDSEAPTQFLLTGREVSCWIQKDDRPGELSVRIAMEDAFASATAGPGQGVNVGFRRRGRWITRSEAFWASTATVELRKPATRSVITAASGSARRTSLAEPLPLKTPGRAGLNSPTVLARLDAQVFFPRLKDIFFFFHHAGHDLVAKYLHRQAKIAAGAGGGAQPAVEVDVLGDLLVDFLAANVGAPGRGRPFRMPWAGSFPRSAVFPRRPTSANREISQTAAAGPRRCRSPVVRSRRLLVWNRCH